MNAQRTQQYGASLNVQVGENWAYSFGAWVRDMDQLTRYTYERSGVYSYKLQQMEIMDQLAVLI